MNNVHQTLRLSIVFVVIAFVAFLYIGLWEVRYARDGETALAQITQRTRELRGTGRSRKHVTVIRFSFKEAGGAMRDGEAALPLWSNAKANDELPVRYIPGVPDGVRMWNLFYHARFLVVSALGFALLYIRFPWAAVRKDLFAISWTYVFIGAIIGCAMTSTVWLSEATFTTPRGPYFFYGFPGAAVGAFFGANKATRWDRFKESLKRTGGESPETEPHASTCSNTDK